MTNWDIHALRRSEDDHASDQTVEQVRERFLWHRAAVTVEAIKVAKELRFTPSQNLTLHKDCVCVLGYGVLLVGADRVNEYNPDLYHRQQVFYYCNKRRKHRAYWITPKESPE